MPWTLIGSRVRPRTVHSRLVGLMARRDYRAVVKVSSGMRARFRRDRWQVDNCGHLASPQWNWSRGMATNVGQDVSRRNPLSAAIPLDLSASMPLPNRSITGVASGDRRNTLVRVTE